MQVLNGLFIGNNLRLLLLIANCVGACCYPVAIAFLLASDSNSWHAKQAHHLCSSQPTITQRFRAVSNLLAVCIWFHTASDCAPPSAPDSPCSFAVLSRLRYSMTPQMHLKASILPSWSRRSYHSVRSSFGLHQSSSTGVCSGMDPVVRYSV